MGFWENKFAFQRSLVCGKICYQLILAIAWVKILIKTFYYSCICQCSYSPHYNSIICHLKALYYWSTRIIKMPFTFNDFSLCYCKWKSSAGKVWIVNFLESFQDSLFNTVSCFLVKCMIPRYRFIKYACKFRTTPLLATHYSCIMLDTWLIC